MREDQSAEKTWPELMHPSISRAVMTCVACPEQYEGELVDGRAFYFRLRHGRAWLGAGVDQEHAADDAMVRPPVPYGDSLTGAFESAEDRAAVFETLLAQLGEPTHAISRAEMGKAALPAYDRDDSRIPSITAEDEAQHPHWPSIDNSAPQHRACAMIRSEHNRTRCLAPYCVRCWGFGLLGKQCDAIMPGTEIRCRLNARHRGSHLQEVPRVQR